MITTTIHHMSRDICAFTTTSQAFTVVEEKSLVCRHFCFDIASEIWATSKPPRSHQTSVLCLKTQSFGGHVCDIVVLVLPSSIVHHPCSTHDCVTARLESRASNHLPPATAGITAPGCLASTASSSSIVSCAPATTTTAVTSADSTTIAHGIALSNGFLAALHKD